MSIYYFVSTPSPMHKCVYVSMYRHTTDTNALPPCVSVDTHSHLHYVGSSHFKFNVFILNQILTIKSECSSWQCSVFPVASGWEGGCSSPCLKTPSGTWHERPVLVAVSSWGRRAGHGAAECSRWGDKTMGNTSGISDCCHCTGSCLQQWAESPPAFCVLLYWGWTPGSQWKQAFPALPFVFCHTYFEDK